MGALRENGANDRSVRRLLSKDAGFSATTVVLGTKRLIVYDPRQPPGRRASSLSHELSHLILEHEAAPAIGIGGCRHWNGMLDWMRQDGNLEEGARNFGVSVELFRWRVNHTGVVRQIAAGR